MKAILQTTILTLVAQLSFSQELLKDISTSNVGSKPRFFAETTDGKIFFTAAKSDNNLAAILYVTNGLPSSTILVKDPNVPLNSGPINVAEKIAIGNKVIFCASEGLASVNYGGSELWVSDGTATGTIRLKDINPGSNSSRPLGMKLIGNKIYFRASNGVSGNELWVTDGTSAGTVMVKDIAAGSNSSNPVIIGEVNGKALLIASNSISGNELWVSDGTTAGTILLCDSHPGTGSLFALNVKILATNVVGRTYLTINNSFHGDELYVTDGTPTGTLNLTESMRPGASASLGASTTAIVLGTNLFFGATSNTHGTELFRTNGSIPSTTLVTDATPGTSNSVVFSPLPVNGKLVYPYFNSSLGTELYVSDGTTMGTKTLVDINAGSPSSDPMNMTVVGNRIVFSAVDGKKGRELWVTDGTTAGTLLLRDINPTSVGTQNLTFSENGKIIVSNKIGYFVANDGARGFELWRTDGTAAGTFMLRDINLGGVSSNPHDFIVAGNRLYFNATDASGNLVACVTDGSITGTVTVNSLNAGVELSLFEGVSLGHGENYFVAKNGDLYVSMFERNIGMELIKINATGVTPLADLNTNQESSLLSGNLNVAASYGSSMIFSYNNIKNGLEVWKTDGTAANTKLLSETKTGQNSNNVNQILNFKGQLYIGSWGQLDKYDGVTYTKSFDNSFYSGNKMIDLNDKLFYTNFLGDLIETDGTTKNIVAASTISRVTLLNKINNTIIFTAFSSEHGLELWKYNGISLQLVKDITAGVAGTNFTNTNSTVVSGNKMYFTIGDTKGVELWVTDGTAMGTFMLRDINPNSASSNPKYLSAYNGGVVFLADNGTNGVEPWRSDGTSAGTQMIADLFPGVVSSGINGLKSFNGNVYFSYYSPTGYVFVRTNGTTITTIKNNFDFRCDGQYDAVYNGSLYFAGSDFSTSNGAELWKTDGTPAGTVLVKNINAVTHSSSGPSNFFVHNNKLFFLATESVTGREIYSYSSVANSIVKTTSEPCQNIVSQTQTVSQSAKIQAGKHIIAQQSNVIKANTSVVYEAGQSIEFKPGFSTEKGAVFEAKLGGCTSTSTQTSVVASNVEPSVSEVVSLATNED